MWENYTPPIVDNEPPVDIIPQVIAQKNNETNNDSSITKSEISKVFNDSVQGLAKLRNEIIRTHPFYVTAKSIKNAVGAILEGNEKDDGIDTVQITSDTIEADFYFKGQNNSQDKYSITANKGGQIIVKLNGKHYETIRNIPPEFQDNFISVFNYQGTYKSNDTGYGAHRMHSSHIRGEFKNLLRQRYY